MKPACPGAAKPQRHARSRIAWWLCGLLLAAPASALAQSVRPWTPPHSDSLTIWASEAKAHFRTNVGDSVGGPNYEPYDRVGRIGRLLLRSLGKRGMAQAAALRGVMDSLGLSTDVQVDPDLPFFTLLMVRNPYRPTTAAVGFLYWYRGDDLRMQGALFPGGHQPRMKVWWTGDERSPYSWGVTDLTPGNDPVLRLTLFRLNPTGAFWALAQHEDTGIHLTGSGTVSWVDMNGDQRSELVLYVPEREDSLFAICSSCPRLVSELVLVERPEGIRLLDTRLVPTPFATFHQFVRLLSQNQRTQAARLLVDPKLLPRAIASGWNVARGKQPWRLDDVETGTAWPMWLMVSFRGPRGLKHYRVDLAQERGRWLIRDWKDRTLPDRPAPRGPASRAPRGVPPPDTTRRSR